ncbi:MAG: universal stress protein [Acidiferrobacterales bacterium]|nr:universal stress protein [Acidiferrobacterales bacterium]
MSNYLAAIDLADEESWAKVIKQTVDMATGIEGAKIYLMTVISGITTGLDQRYAVRGEMQGSAEYPMSEWKQEALEKLESIAKEQIPLELVGGVVVENGTVYREIVQAVKDLDINQVVMGAHRPSLADFLLGPNTARVARHAECSVTVVR